MSKQKYLENLNKEQQKAVKHLSGPILVLAGAGTGKTRVLTTRVANLILQHQVRPEKILAVTFTNKATNEMRERLENLLGGKSKQIWIATFHSAALRILRYHANKISYRNDFVVYDTQDSQAVMKALLKKLGLESQKFKPGYYLHRIDQFKNNFISPEEFDPTHYERQQMLPEVYDAYQKELIQSNAMDFTDLIFNCLKLLKEFPDVRALYQRQLDYILIDEFQDTNLVQYEIVKYLAEPKQNLLVVGDDDQSIYAFRGADIRNILTFENDFADTKIVTLEQNYRSTQNILDAAFAVIQKNKTRKNKKLWSDSDSGQKLQLQTGLNEHQEAENIVEEINLLVSQGNKLSQMAVFYRTNAQSRAIEEAFLREGIAYRIFGSFKFYERKEVKDVLAYLRLIYNPNDNQALVRIINTPKRGVGAQTLKSIICLAEDNHCSYLEASNHESLSNTKLKDFYNLISDLKKFADQDHTIAELIRKLLEKTKYLDSFNMDDPKDQERHDNVMELVALTEEFTSKNYSLAEFLDHIALMTAVDKSSGNVEEDSEYCSLMTLHLAKGLEFPVVFLTGLEEGLLPHARSIEEDNISEERRLCYVGITRAKEKLYLSYAIDRGFASANSSFGYGTYGRSPSRFITDIPTELIENKGEEILIEEDDDYFYDDYIDVFNQKQKKKNKKKKQKNIDSLIKPADEL